MLRQYLALWNILFWSSSYPPSFLLNNFIKKNVVFLFKEIVSSLSTLYYFHQVPSKKNIFLKPHLLLKAFGYSSLIYLSTFNLIFFCTHQVSLSVPFSLSSIFSLLHNWLSRLHIFDCLFVILLGHFVLLIALTIVIFL